MIKLQKNLYEGKDVGYSQLFGENPAWYAKFGLKGHNGIDIPIPTGTKLYSAIEGTVIEAQNDPQGYGLYVKIENDGCGILYGHLKSFSVKVGDKVKAGQLIGYSDNTGNSTGPHLHFGVFPKPRDRANGYAGYIDPLDRSLVGWVKDYYAEENATAGIVGALEGKIKALEEELDKMRESRNDWRKKYKTLEELYEKETSELILHRDVLQKELAEANSKIEALQKAVLENKTPLSAYSIKERIVSILDSILRGDKI